MRMEKKLISKFIPLKMGAFNIISINGISTSDIVNLSIKNEKNELVWAEQISVKNNDTYSTLAIAGGNGWENSGTYSLMVDDGSKTKFTKFSFTS